MSWAGSKEHQATWGAYQNPQNPQYYNQQYYPGYDANAAYANQAAYQNQHAYAQGYGGYVDPNAAAYYGQVAPGAVVPAATAQQTGEGGEEAETKKAKRLAVHGNRETMNLPNILLRLLGHSGCAETSCKIFSVQTEGAKATCHRKVGDFVKDDQEFTLADKGKRPTTMGKFIIMILTEMRFFDVLFPRIPQPVVASIRKKLAEEGITVGPADTKKISGGSDRRKRKSSELDKSRKDSDRSRRDRDRSPRRDRDRSPRRKKRREHSPRDRGDRRRDRDSPPRRRRGRDDRNRRDSSPRRRRGRPRSRTPPRRRGDREISPTAMAVFSAKPTKKANLGSLKEMYASLDENDNSSRKPKSKRGRDNFIIGQ